MSSAGLRQRRNDGGKLSRKVTTKERELESFDFDELLSPVLEAELRSRTAWELAFTSAWRWALLLMTGTGVATLAVLIIASCRLLQRLKFTVVYALIDRERNGDLSAGVSFLAFLGISLSYALLASLPVVLIEPSAAGSGIPEVVGVLNGIKLPHALRLKTLVVRVFGVAFSVASGLPAGYEGPMISIGAAVGAGLSQGKSTTLGFDTRWTIWSAFRRDAAKRDFITTGSAAGIASAFNAPIGGVLFALEEGSSHWKRSLAWRCFAASLVGAFLLDFLLSGLNGYINLATGSTDDGGVGAASWGELNGDAMLSLGSFSATGQTSLTWGLWELPIYAGIGVIGGVVGALFVAANARLTKWRVARAAKAGTVPAPNSGKASKPASPVQMQPITPAPLLRADSSQPLLGPTDRRNSSASQPDDFTASSAQSRASSPRSPAKSERGSAAASPTAGRSLAASRVAEVVAVTTVVSAVAFLAPVLLGSCMPLPTSASSNRYSGQYVTLYCEAGTFNPLASLWLSPQEESIRFLMHFSAGNGTVPAVNVTGTSGGSGLHSGTTGGAARILSAARGLLHETGAAGGSGAVGTASSFSPIQLGFFFCFYTLMMCITSGISLPSGLFIPTLLSGAAIGRLIGEGINRLAGASDAALAVDPGTYALIGAAAVTAGVTRLSVALACILLESSGNFSLSLPLALTIMTARAVGNLFGRGIYETTSHLKKLPVLDGVPTALEYQLRACDVMRSRPLVFSEIETVDRIHHVLTTTAHNGFPVVFSEAMAKAQPRLGSLAGFVQRRHLAVILYYRAFHAAPPRSVHQLPSLAEAAALAAAEESEAAASEGGGSPSAGAALNRGVYQVRYGSSRPPAGSSSSGSAGLAVGFGSRDRLSDLGSDADAGEEEDDEQEELGEDAEAGRRGSGGVVRLGRGTGPAREKSSRGLLASPVGGRFPSFSAGGGTPRGGGGGGAGGLTSSSSSGNLSGLGGGGSRRASGHVGSGLLAPVPVTPMSRSVRADVRLRMPSVGSSHDLFALTAPGPGMGPGSSFDENDEIGVSSARAHPPLPPQQRYQPPSLLGSNRGGSHSPSARKQPADSGAAVTAARTGTGVGAFTTVHVRQAAALSAAAATAGGYVATRAMSGEGTRGPMGLGAARGDSQQHPLLSADAGMRRASHTQPDGTSAYTSLRDQRQLDPDATNAPGVLQPHPSTASGSLSADLYRALYASEVLYEEEPLLSFEHLESMYPRYPDPREVQLSASERGFFVDLRPYSDPSPYTVHVHSPLVRVFRLFRGLGLRHLLVVNDSHDVVGIITRHDLTREALTERARELGLAGAPLAS